MIVNGYGIRPFANLRGANLSDVNLRGADLCSANLSDVNLRGADLRSADLCSANLSDVNLRGANLRGADLSEADLRGADLRSADLRSADLCSANLRGADLSDVNLRGANLRGADLSDVNLRGANLRDVNLRWSHGIILIQGAIGDGYDRFAYICGGVIRIKAGCRDFDIDEARKHWGGNSQDKYAPVKLAIANALYEMALALKPEWEK